jgi:pimeloyl-ACP methyl ester carboxylesterase
MGDRKMNYLGFSYGSVLGQTYANLFPGKVRALAIDGVVDPRTWAGRGVAGRTVPLGARLRSDVGAQKTLKEFFRLCDQSGSAGCALAGNAGKRYATLAAKLRAHPQDMPGGGRFTYADLVSITLGVLYASYIWPDAATFFADIERQAKPAALRRDLAVVRGKLGLAAKPQEQYPNYVEGGPAVACSDSNNPATFTAWTTTAARTERQHGYFGRPWTWTWSECLAWPKAAGQDRYLGPWTARTAQPVLVIGNYFDPATRYGGAIAASQLLPRSRLLTYAGWGHTAFLTQGNFCVNSAVTRYLVEVRTPAAGKVCRPEGSPFGPQARAAGSSGAAAVVTGATLPQAVRQALTRR